MYPRFAFALLFSVCAFGLGIAAPAFPEQVHDIPMQFPSSNGGFPQCPDNEEFNACGSACAPSCANPHPSPVCTKNCVIGCFCKQGHLRNGRGLCVPTQKCNAPEASMLFAYPPEISQCKENEVFMPCGSACAPTCANPRPGPVCTLQCVVGCFCKPGYLKNEHGICIQSENCGVPAAMAVPLPPQMCEDNEEFRQCKGCDGTCDKPNPICPRICVPGCACKQGHLRSGPNGRCILAAQCPKVEPVPLASSMLFAYPPEVSQCKENEVFMPCGSACAPTCANPRPSPVCTRQCVVGCFCKPGYLKNEHGVCVQSENCGVPAAMAVPLPAQMCEDNEEFRQCKGCDGTCDKPNPICPRICVPGCACKQGHLRSGPNGRCILAAQCPKVDPTSFMMLPPVPKCGENEVFHSCGTACPASCANPHPSPVCTKNCVIGCFCQEGHLRNEHGVCVAAANCVASKPDPQGPVHVSLFAEPAQPEGQCASDREIYSECGQQLDCLASCGTPLPFLIHGAPQVPKRCLERSCTPGCVCKKPYVRNTDGRCVEREECEHKNPFATTPSH